MGTMIPALCRWAILFFVPAVVWITLAAGVYQLVRDRVRRLGLAPRGSNVLAQKPAR
jgi:hypothetical protein